MKRILVNKQTSLIVLLLIMIIATVSCTGQSSFKYNLLDEYSQPAAPYIVGAYYKEISYTELHELTGIDIIQSLPQKYKEHKVINELFCNIDDSIINAYVYLMDESNATILNVNIHSHKLWSNKGFSDIDYSFDNGVTISTDINNINAKMFSAQIPRQEKQIYICNFKHHDLTYELITWHMEKDEFEVVVTNIITQLN